MRKYIVNQFEEPFLDASLTVTEWIEIHSLQKMKDEHAETRTRFAHDLPPDKLQRIDGEDGMIEVKRALTDETMYVPWTRLREQFPDLDPAQVAVGSGYEIVVNGSLDQALIDAEFARRGWRPLRLSTDSQTDVRN